jgi:hypothetical protein
MSGRKTDRQRQGKREREREGGWLKEKTETYSRASERDRKTQTGSKKMSGREKDNLIDGKRDRFIEREGDRDIDTIHRY